MKKNKIIGIVIFLSIFIQTTAQEKGKIGFTFSVLNKSEILHSAALNHDYITQIGRGFMSFGVDYWYPIHQWLELETGINYGLHSFSKLYDNPNVVNVTAPTPENFDAHLINIPIGIRANFIKYGFINSGILVDLLHEPGIGSYFGAGVRIDSEVGFAAFLNPYVKAHSLLPVSFNQNANRILEMGIRIGVSYSFDNVYRNRRR